MSPRRGFLSQAITLAGGTMIAQGLALAVTPLVARLYGVEDFGVFALYAVTVGVPGVAVCWLYEPAILIPKDETEARDILFLSLAITVFMALLFTLPLLAASRVADAFNAPQLAPWLVFVPIHLLALGVTQALTYWLTRRSAFGRLSGSRVTQAIVTSGTQVAAGATIPGPVGLIGGQLAGQLAAAAWLGRGAVRGEKGIESTRPTLTRLMAVMRRYYRFPLYSGVGTVLGAISLQIVPVLLAREFSATEAGLYFFGARLMSAAVLLASTSVGQVFAQRAALEMHEGRGVGPLVERVVVRLALLAVAGFGSLVLLGPMAFRVAFGAEWVESAYYLRLVTPLYFFQLLASPVSGLLFLLEKQQIAAGMQVALLVSAAGSLILAQSLSLSARGTLGLYGAAQGVIYLAYLFAILRVASASARGILRALLSPGPLLATLR